MTRRRWILAACALALVASGSALALVRDTVERDAVVVRRERVRVAPSISVAARIYTLRDGSAQRRPAVLLTHGLGDDVRDVDGMARMLARAGYVVRTWTARGGRGSQGRASIAAPGAEVADVRALVDDLARRANIQLDDAGDPRVAAVGISYGAGTSLLAAERDPRIDAVVSIFGWGSLFDALEPNAARRDAHRTDPAGGVRAAGAGVLRSGWGSVLYAAGFGDARSSMPCGRLERVICDAWADAIEHGQFSRSARDLLDARSPVRASAQLRVPTLFVHGQMDSLFDLDQVTPIARSLRARAVPTRIVWVRAGHDLAPEGDAKQLLDTALRDWLAAHVRRSVPRRDGAFTIQLGAGRGAASFPTLTAKARVRRIALRAGRAASHGSALPIVAPPAGLPEELTVLPGLGDVTQLAGHIAPPRAQRARFTSPRITRGMEIIGAPGVRLHVRGSRDEAVLFVRLLDLGAHGQQHLVRGLVAPVRISGIPPLRGAASRVVDVRLAPIAWRVAPGHRLAIEVATTDAAYRAARPAASYRVAVDDATGLRVPVATMRHAMLTPITEGGERTAPFTRIGASVGVAALLALLAGAIVTHHRRRRRGACEASPPTGAPIEARGLTKRYRTSRRRAVDDVDLTIRPGRIVGLVGPNGAGKTTMLRMLVGLTRPSCGCAWLFGEPVEPGVGALRRVGVFIDGPGLDQHATMRQQLHRYARVAGRPHDRQAIDRALAHVDLLDRAEQRISTASHGMRQRLGIAQALLGDPELVILDEPANGLDPLQIHQLRLLLRAIADEGRTVLVSSHILSELELLCDDAVLILDGRVAAAGPIADVTGAHASLEAALLANIQHPEPT